MVCSGASADAPRWATTSGPVNGAGRGEQPARGDLALRSWSPASGSATGGTRATRAARNPWSAHHPGPERPVLGDVHDRRPLVDGDRAAARHEPAAVMPELGEQPAGVDPTAPRRAGE